MHSSTIRSCIAISFLHLLFGLGHTHAPETVPADAPEPENMPSLQQDGRDRLESPEDGKATWNGYEDLKAAGMEIVLMSIMALTGFVIAAKKNQPEKPVAKDRVATQQHKASVYSGQVARKSSSPWKTVASYKLEAADAPVEPVHVNGHTLWLPEMCGRLEGSRRHVFTKLAAGASDMVMQSAPMVTFGVPLQVVRAEARRKVPPPPDDEIERVYLFFWVAQNYTLTQRRSLGQDLKRNLPSTLRCRLRIQILVPENWTENDLDELGAD